MELRSTRQRQDQNQFKELKITLTGLGYYEDGMNLQEMQQIMAALQQSEGNFLDADIERALRESELDFIQMSDSMANSTMITTITPQRVRHQSTGWTSVHNEGSTLMDSPEMPAQQITVTAEVHHPLDWSPTPPMSEGRRRSPNRQFSPLYNDGSSIPAFTINNKINLILADGTDTADVQRNDSGLSLSGGSATSSILTVGSSCTSSSAHSEYSHSSQDVESRNYAANNHNADAAEMSWEDRIQASSSSAVISSDDNQISNIEEDSTDPFIFV